MEQANTSLHVYFEIISTWNQNIIYNFYLILYILYNWYQKEFLSWNLNFKIKHKMLSLYPYINIKVIICWGIFNSKLKLKTYLSFHSWWYGYLDEYCPYLCCYLVSIFEVCLSVNFRVLGALPSSSCVDLRALWTPLGPDEGLWPPVGLQCTNFELETSKNWKFAQLWLQFCAI